MNRTERIEAILENVNKRLYFQAINGFQSPRSSRWIDDFRNTLEVASEEELKAQELVWIDRK